MLKKEKLTSQHYIVLMSPCSLSTQTGPTKIFWENQQPLPTTLC